MREILPDGFAQAAHASLPVAGRRRPTLVALLDVALAALAGVAVWQIVVRRRPVAGLVAIGVGLAYCWTVRPPDSPALGGRPGARGVRGGARARRLAGLASIRGAPADWGAPSSSAVWRCVLAVGLGSGPAQGGRRLVELEGLGLRRAGGGRVGRGAST